MVRAGDRSLMAGSSNTGGPRRRTGSRTAPPIASIDDIDGEVARGRRRPTTWTPRRDRDLDFEAVYRYNRQGLARTHRSGRDRPGADEERLRAGASADRFQFRAPPGKGWDGIVNREVLRSNRRPGSRNTWKGGPLDTRVWITLEAVAGGTRLSLDHTGFRGPKALLVSLIMGRGWRGIVATGIRDVVARSTPGSRPRQAPRAPTECCDERDAEDAARAAEHRRRRLPCDLRPDSPRPARPAPDARPLRERARRTVSHDAARDLAAPARTEACGLVQPQQIGRRRVYRLNAKPLRQVRDWAARYERFWQQKLAALGDYLDR